MIQWESVVPLCQLKLHLTGNGVSIWMLKVTLNYAIYYFVIIYISRKRKLN
jgi:hypothetical protein